MFCSLLCLESFFTCLTFTSHCSVSSLRCRSPFFLQMIPKMIESHLRPLYLVGQTPPCSFFAISQHLPIIIINATRSSTNQHKQKTLPFHFCRIIYIRYSRTWSLWLTIKFLFFFLFSIDSSFSLFAVTKVRPFPLQSFHISLVFTSSLDSGSNVSWSKVFAWPWVILPCDSPTVLIFSFVCVLQNTHIHFTLNTHTHTQS